MWQLPRWTYVFVIVTVTATWAIVNLAATLTHGPVPDGFNYLAGGAVGAFLPGLVKGKGRHDKGEGGN